MHLESAAHHDWQEKLNSYLVRLVAPAVCLRVYKHYIYYLFLPHTVFSTITQHDKIQRNDASEGKTIVRCNKWMNFWKIFTIVC